LIELAREVATKYGEAEDWEAMFHLIRKIAQFARENGLACRVFRPVVAGYCEAANRSDEVSDFWACFREKWEVVRLGEGESPLEWAAAMAQRRPRLIDEDEGEEQYNLVGSTAWYLHELRQGGAFWIPGNHLGRLLDIRERTLYRHIDRPKKEGKIRCLGGYDMERKRARHFVWIGEEPRLGN
jgi:hypothetical protein